MKWAKKQPEIPSGPVDLEVIKERRPLITSSTRMLQYERRERSCIKSWNEKTFLIED